MNDLQVKIGIVGCGLIGAKRARSLCDGAVLVAAADKEVSKAVQLVEGTSAEPYE